MKRQLNCVLLVDDDHITNYMNLRLIKGLGMATHIQVSMNGKDALAYLKSEKGSKHKPDLIFLDINMPVMDGFEFMEEYNRIKDEFSFDAIVCILTTSTNVGDRRRVEDLALGFPINKPLTAIAVNEVVDKFFIRASENKAGSDLLNGAVTDLGTNIQDTDMIKTPFAARATHDGYGGMENAPVDTSQRTQNAGGNTYRLNSPDASVGI